MKFRLLDRITGYTPNYGISVVHAVSFEEILSVRRIGGVEAPRTFLPALAAEAAGFFYAAESDFRLWAYLSELEDLKINLSDPGDHWHLELKKNGSSGMLCTGSLCGSIKLEEVELATLYDPEERRAMFKALQRS